MDMANTGETFRNGEATVSHARDALGNVVREVKNLNASLLDDAKDRAGLMATRVKKDSKAALSHLQHQVTEKPALSVGIAVGAGILLGLLFSARR